MPRSSLKRQQFGAKKPYLAAAAASLVLIVWAFGLFYNKLATIKQQKYDELMAKVDPMAAREHDMNAALQQLAMARASADQLSAWLGDRSYWAKLIIDLRGLFIEVENQGKKEFGTDTGMWIESFEPVVPAGGAQSEGTFRGPRRGGGRGGRGGGFTPPPGPTPTAPSVPAIPGAPGGPGGPGGPGFPGGPINPAGGGTNTMAMEGQISHVNLRCRLVDLKKVSDKVSADANTKFAFMLETALSKDLNFVPGSARFGQLEPAGDNLTWTFQVTLTLSRPLKL
jgi:hypothetical protein